MPHEAELITTIAASLGLAMLMGYIAARVKMPPMAGEGSRFRAPSWRCAPSAIPSIPR